MRLKAFYLIGGIIILFVIALVLLTRNTSFEDRYVVFESGNEVSVIRPFKTNDGYAVVVPSSWNVDSLRICERDNKSSFWVRDIINIENSEEVPEGAMAIYKALRGGQLCVYQCELATMMIWTSSLTLEELNQNKGNEDYGDIIILNDDGAVCYEGELESIHGRGNSTWKAGKKPYKIKIRDKVSVLGMKEGKTYCLLANSFDHSNLRNYIAYKTALEFGTAMPVECEFLNLFINGNFLGLYLLTTNPGISTNGINIDNLGKLTKKQNKGVSPKPYSEGFSDKKQLGSLSSDKGAKKGFTGWDNPTDITGGYVIEATGHLSTFNEKPSGFVSQHNIPISIREPKYATKEQVEYISKLFDEIDEAVCSSNGVNPITKKHYSEYIDVESFIKYYLIQEAFLTIGPGLGSFKMFKNVDDKECSLLTAGPIWDFDNSMANADYELTRIPEVLYAWKGIANHPTHYKGLLSELMSHEESVRQAKSCYPQLDFILKQWFQEGRLDGVVSKVSSDAHLNEMRWPEVNAISFEDDVNIIKQFMGERIMALTSFFSSEEDYNNHLIFIDAGYTTLQGTYNTMTFYCPDAYFQPPVLKKYYGSGNYILRGLYYSSTDEKYEPTIIEKPTTLRYIWEQQR